MRVVVGLGNPGPEYAGTRHNAGQMAVRRLAERWECRVGRKLCASSVGEGMWQRWAVRLVLPETFMNSSGEAVGCLVKRWRLGPEALLVVLDDVSLPLGSVRIRGEGSAGGHLGLESVLEAVGTQAVPRLRIGVGPGRGKDLTSFVLGRFTAREGKALEEGLGLAMEACETWVAHGLSVAMNRFNRRLKVKSDE